MSHENKLVGRPLYPQPIDDAARGTQSPQLALARARTLSLRGGGDAVTIDVRERYLTRLPAMREAARACGYALAVHGSETRDFDVIAAPWIETASGPFGLVHAICIAIDGFISEDKEYPVHKPHGRLSWSIQIGGGAYIDLSVMPLHPSI